MQLYHLSGWQSFTNVTILKVERSSHTCNDVCSLLHCFKRATVRPHTLHSHRCRATVRPHTLHSHRCRATVRPHTLHSHRCSEPAVLYRKWNGKPRMGHVSMSIFNNNNNNNKGYLDLEHLTCTNPKWLHILYMTNMYTHTAAYHYQGNGTEEEVFKKRKIFKEGFQERERFSTATFEDPCGCTAPDLPDSESREMAEQIDRQAKQPWQAVCRRTCWWIWSSA